MFLDLTEHHYVSKCQSEFFKQRKASLANNECVVVLDFAENYSFIVQDAAVFAGIILKQLFILL